MDRSLVAVPLTAEQAVQIFPLARALAPELDLDAWRRFARRRSNEPDVRGIIGIRDTLGYFHALFDYEIRQDVTARPTLEIGLAVALDLLDGASSTTILMNEIDALAARLGCHAVHVRLRPNQRRLRRSLERDGHSLQSIVLGKSTATADA